MEHHHKQPETKQIQIPLVPETIKVRWAGKIALQNTEIALVPSSLALDEQIRKAAREEFAQTMQPGQSDANRLRYEGVHEAGGSLTVQASTGISYGEHNIRRFVTDVSEDQTINPLTMYMLLQDKNGNFIGGVWNQDQKGKIASAPVGFLDAPSEEGHPLREFVEEIRLKFNQVQLGDAQAQEVQNALESTEVRGIISGVNQDTTILMFARTSLSADAVGLASKYSSKVLIPPQKEVLEQVLRDGHFEGMEVNDLFLVGLAIYLRDLS